MRQAATELIIETPGRALVDVTARLTDWVAEQAIRTGLLTVFCRHTSASVMIQENADPSVRADLLAWFDRIAPEDRRLYDHDAEGPDDMPAHLRAALTGAQLSIPVMSSRLSLGTWQAAYLCEHRRAPHRRRLALHLLGD
jgi:secondary thiamine-phosphate synthase enzyme